MNDKSAFSPILISEPVDSTQRTIWSKPPSTMMSRMGRKEKQREEVQQLTLINNLRKAFEDADVDNLGYLTQSTWDKSEIRNYIHNPELSDSEFSLFFRRIDATSEGKITWNDIVNYMLKETSGLKSVKNNDEIQFIRKWPSPIRDRSQLHREMICQILCSNKTNEYITISNDSVRFWNISDLSFRRVINDTSLFCCGLLFDNVSALALATTNRRLLFYNIEYLGRLPIEVCASPPPKAIKNLSQAESRNFLRNMKISEQPMFNVPSAMCIAENSIIDPFEVPFFVGNEQGMIEVYNLSLPKRRSGVDYAVKRLTKVNIHEAKITQISAVTSALYASSGLDNRIIFFSFHTSDNSFQINKIFVDSEPITSFAFNSRQKNIATCGISRDAYIWSYVAGTKISKLAGHYTQITKILNYRSSTNENYILTMSCNKVFRVWDPTSFLTIREFSDSDVLRPENRYSAVLFDPLRSQMIAASTEPYRWSEDAAAINSVLRKRTHGRQIVGTFYSPEFNQLVSVDTACSIKLWNIFTGTLESNHVEINNKDQGDIAAATLDCQSRALITNSFKNNVCLWNYNNGSLIAEIALGQAKSPITVIRCFTSQGKNYFARAGWDKTIWLYNIINSTTYELIKTFSGHTHDICELQPYSSGIISGAVNGELLSWSLDTTTPISRYIMEPETSIESSRTIDNTLFVCDSNGFLHILTIPKLERIRSLSAHEITKRHSLTCIEYSPKQKILCTSDNLGYVKKWKLEYKNYYDIIPIKIYRCHIEEILSLVFLKDGEFLATCGKDMYIRLFRTSDFAYINFFAVETSWNLYNIETWINEPPAVMDDQHFCINNSLLTKNDNSDVITKIKPTKDEFSHVTNHLFDQNEIPIKSHRAKSDLKHYNIIETSEPVEFNLSSVQEILEDIEKNFGSTNSEQIVVKQEEAIPKPRKSVIPSLQTSSRPEELESKMRNILSWGEKKDSEKPTEVDAKKNVKMPISSKNKSIPKYSKSYRGPK